MTASSPAKAPAPSATGPTVETVLSVEHYTDDLFSFRITRPQGFRFRAGEFVMIGLMVNGKPLMRAYSVASPTWDEELEFFSIKVPDGPLTSRLKGIKVGDEVLLGRKSTGTLVLDALTPARNLFLFSTGTGFAPFASVIQDPETYEKFEHVIVTHTCRTVDELQYSTKLLDHIVSHEFLGELSAGALTFIDTVTREAHPRKGRITEWLETGRLAEHVGLARLSPDTDRAMICGSTAMLNDTKDILERAGFEEGSNAKPADFVIEKAFVG